MKLLMARMAERIGLKSMNKLRPYQETGVDFLCARQTALLADDMGLGKTMQAIVAAEAANRSPIVVVCPSTIKDQWSNKFHQWFKDWIAIQVIRTGEDRIRPAHIYIVSFKLSKLLVGMDIETLIIDEAHYCKNIESQRTLMVLGKNGLRGHAKRTWALTGTPIFNRPMDLYSLLVSLRPNVLNGMSPEEFGVKFNSAYWPRQVYYRTLSNMRLGKARNLDQLKPMLDGFMLRRLKKDVLDELPSIDVNMINAEVCSKRKLNTLKDKYEKLKTRKEAANTVRDQRGERVKLRHDYAYLKIDFSIEFLKNELEKYNKVTVFCYHRDVAEELQVGLRKYKPVIYQGGMNDREKQETLDAFIKGDSRVFIGQIRAAGTGLDGLQEVCNRGVFLEWDYAPGAVNQTIDRLYRMGQRKGVNITFLVIPDSIESDMIKSLISKREENKKVLD